MNRTPYLEIKPIKPAKGQFIDLPSASRHTLFGRTTSYLKSLQRTDGYFWFTLEANETIGAEFIFLMHYLESVDSEILAGIANRILDVQRADGTWALYHDGPADLSMTIECYFALKLAGISTSDPQMLRAREYVLNNGGIENARVFTKIHLAMFGLVPWSACPAMPAEFILLPKWFPVTIYEFSSWARATIVPLLIFMSARHVVKIPKELRIDELFVNTAKERDHGLKTKKGILSQEYLFILLDHFLKLHEKLPFKPLRKYAINKCSEWTREHVRLTEDIYPALAYGALAFKALGFAIDSPEVKKPFEALKMFQQAYGTHKLPKLPDEVRDNGFARPSQLREIGIDPKVKLSPSPQPSSIKGEGANSVNPLSPCGRGLGRGGAQNLRVHQQCCISPVWDTPWMVTALLEAGIPNDDPALLKAGRWLLSKQITQVKGDWAIKNPNAAAGGWAFEFENDHFPDVDDTIQVITALKKLGIPEKEKANAIRLGLDWIISMQNSDGGWAAFDKNQNCKLVNRIPFSDHGACLDPSSPDITGRMLELLADFYFSKDSPQVKRALDYIWRTQEKFGGWFARWGINYIYGTWCVLTGLNAIGWPKDDPRIVKAVKWLESIQHEDGGFGESAASYDKKTYVPWKESVPSQTAWALMALVAGGAKSNHSATRAAEFLLSSRNEKGSWNETAYTGTGFPGHFYIRYHGYRHYFPLLALARYNS